MVNSLDDLKSPHFWRALGAEFVGTFVLTLVVCGSAIDWKDGSGPTVVQIAFTVGLTIATMVWSISHVSGGHINPAVSVAFMVTRKISLVRGVLFCLVQCVGALVAALVLVGIVPEDYRGSLGTTLPNGVISDQQAFGVEFLCTFILVLTIFASVDNLRRDLNGSTPLAIGLAATSNCLFAIKLTGCSMNPARSFGPALVMNIWKHHWVYWCGPLLGGVFAALLYENVFSMTASLSKAKSFLLSADYDPERERAVKVSTIKKHEDAETDDEAI